MTVHCCVTLAPDGSVTSTPSLKVSKTTMPRWPSAKASLKVRSSAMVSNRAWIGRGRRQSFGSGKPQRIGTMRRFSSSASQMMTGRLPPTR